MGAGNAKSLSLFRETGFGTARARCIANELTDVVVTDISLLRLPPARPYEYLLNAGVSAVMQVPQSTVSCHTVYRESWQCLEV